jgi:hypothetical protein
MNSAPHRWRFFRAGGFDQVRLDTGADLLAMEQPDQKLWVALSCPVRGIEFDARTLALIDEDGDGHLRAPELIAAVRWASERLKDPETLARKQPGVSIADIRDESDKGARIVAAACALLCNLGKGEGDVVSVGEASSAQARFAERSLAAWEAARNSARPLGEATEAAHASVAAVTEKVEDYFVHCRLAAFDTRAAGALNVAEGAFTSLAAGMLNAQAEGIAALPLARVEAGAPLPLRHGVNPAWAEAIGALRDSAVTPLCGVRDSLAETDWQTIKAQSARFDAGKFAGIFAAVGLAIGAIGTALAAMVTGLLALKWWQIPLALAGPGAGYFRSSGDSRLVQAEKPQPRPDSGCQRLGDKRPRLHQHSLRHVAHPDRAIAGQRRALAHRSLRRKENALEPLPRHTRGSGPGRPGLAVPRHAALIAGTT